MSQEPFAQTQPPRPAFASVGQMIHVLVIQPDLDPRPADEDWAGMIARISRFGIVSEVDEETFDYFLDVLPPRYQARCLFAFAEGAEPLRLFVAFRGRYRCRRLNEDETRDFCRLAGIQVPW